MSANPEPDPSEAESQLERCLESLNVPEIQRQALDAIAHEPYGLDLDAAESLLAASIDSSMIEASRCLRDILSAGYLRRHDLPSGPRLVINATALRCVSEEALRVIARQGALSRYELLGTPHSDRGMATLGELLEGARGTVYLGVDETTSPDVFKKLAYRASKGWPTTIIMPPQSNRPTARDAAKAWQDLIKSDPRVRQHVRIYRTRAPRPSLYTSAITEELARFDFYSLKEGRTRKGELVQVTPESSLYRLLLDEYTSAYSEGTPPFWLWPWERTLLTLRRYSILFILIIVFALLLFFGGPSAAVAVGFLVSFFATLAYEKLQVWTPTRHLF